jgi:hypothetical protein
LVRARSDLLAVAFIVTAYLVLVALVSPVHEFPLNDDWIHALAVRHLLNTGELRLPGNTALSLISTLYWGALFARLLGGLSFTALRLSTLVDSLIGAVGFYGLLRQLGLGRHGSLLAACTLIASPMYLYLSYTFHTDVPFLALMILALNAYVLGVRRAAAGWLLVGSVLTALSFLSRQPGIGLLGGAIAGLGLRQRGLSLRLVLADSAMPLATFLIYTYWLNYIHGVPWIQTTDKVGGTLAFLARPDAPALVVSRILASLPYLGLWVSPFVAGQALTLAGNNRPELDRQSVVAIAVALVAVGLIAFATSKYPVGLPYFHNVINWNGLGNMSLMGTKVSVVPAWINRFAQAAGTIAGGVLAARGLQAIWQGRLFNRQDPALGIIVSGSVLVAGGYFLLADFFDRYLLALIPLSIALVWPGWPLSRMGRLAAWLVCAVLAAYSVVGLTDHLAWNEARWAAGRALVSQGIAPEAIDGGYEWIGWHEFESAPLPPPNPPADFDSLYWMHLSPRKYWLSFTPLEGYSIHSVVPYGSHGAIYVLTR